MSLSSSSAFSQIKKHWFAHPRADVLSGTVVALALIPEAIAFSIIAGVDPKIGLYASFVIAVMTAFLGGRPGMISAATGAMALLMVNLVKVHGVQYLFAATVLTGLVQIAFARLKLGRYMRFVPHSVMIGFVNALAILIFLAQLPEFVGAGWPMYAMVAAGLTVIYLLPRFTKVVPSPLVAIVGLTAVAMITRADVRTVADMGALPSALPTFAAPLVPLTFETIRIIFPYSVTLAIVGLLESLLTASVVDDMTETPSNKDRECQAQGLANVVTGFFGGMAGCAMIGQSMINIKSGGRGRLSSLCAGLFLLFFVVVLGDWVGRIPMAALVAVMFTVAIGTFDWRSVTRFHRKPVTEGIVMIATVGTVVLTHDLAKGVLVGVLLSGIFFARTVAKLAQVESDIDAAQNTRVYRISGELFFASVSDFVAAFDFQEDVARVKIDLTAAHVWDGSAVAAIDRVVLRFRRRGIQATVGGLNEASARLYAQLAEHDKPGATTGVTGH